MIFFVSIVSDISKSIPSVEGNSFYKYLKEPIINSFYFHQITKNYIYNALIDINIHYKFNYLYFYECIM